MSLKSEKLYSFKLYLEIQKINLEAAEYFWSVVMRDEMWGVSLSGAFIWSDTPQEPSFWVGVDQQVRHLVKKEDLWGELR